MSTDSSRYYFYLTCLQVQGTLQFEIPKTNTEAEHGYGPLGRGVSEFEPHHCF